MKYYFSSKKIYNFENKSAYLITIDSSAQNNVFGNIEEGIIKLSKIGSKIINTLKNHKENLIIDTVLVMHNYINLIIIFDKNTKTKSLKLTNKDSPFIYSLHKDKADIDIPVNILKFVRKFKTKITKTYKKYNLWNKNFYEFLITNQEQLKNHRKILHYLPLEFSADWYRRIAWVTHFQNKYEKANYLFRKSISLYKKIKPVNHQDYLQALRGFALTYSFLLQSEKSIEISTDIVKIIKKWEKQVNLKPAINLEKLKTCCSLSIALSKKGEIKKCLKQLDNAYETAAKLKNNYYLTIINQGYGINSAKQEKFKESIEYYNKALKTSDSKLKRAELMMYKGNSYFALKRIKQALKLFLKAFDIFQYEEIQDYSIHYSLGLCYSELNENKKALEHYTIAIELLEKSRNVLKDYESRIMFTGKRMHIYDNAIETVMKFPDRQLLLLSLIDKTKSRSFNEKILNRTNQSSQNNDIEYFKRLNIKIDKHYSDYYRAKLKNNEKNKNKYLNLLKKSEIDKKDFLLKLKYSSPDLYSFVELPDFNIHKIQDNIPANSVCIDYYCGINNILVFIIDRYNIVPVKIKIEHNRHKEYINNFVKFLQKFQFQSMSNSVNQIIRQFNWFSNKLYNIIFKKIEPYITDYENIFIIPHKELHNIPFATLTDSKGKYLIDKYNIYYLPGLRYIEMISSKKNNINNTNCLIFANATDDLPYSEIEAKKISELFNSKTYVSKNATETNFKMECNNYDIIHFACHADYRTDNPEFSHVLLADDIKGVNRLEINEIIELDMKKVKLVTLSTCLSGVSNPVKGDEFISIARAFLFAGADAVIVSLWEVDDKVTSELMHIFYQQLKKTGNPGLSLRTAQIKIKKEYPSLHYWAAFKIVGYTEFKKKIATEIPTTDIH